MLNFNVFESLNFSCFCRSPTIEEEEELPPEPAKSRHKAQRDRYSLDMDGVYRVARKYKISFLPVGPNFELTNLYPLTNHVELWNVLVVGRDKSYILASIRDPHTRIPADGMLNRKGEESLPHELVKLFDIFWTKTLEDRQLQLFLVWNGKLYLVNTYAFKNPSGAVIGAVMFMRAFSGDDTVTDPALDAQNSVGLASSVGLDAQSLTSSMCLSGAGPAGSVGHNSMGLDAQNSVGLGLDAQQK